MAEATVIEPPVEELPAPAPFVEEKESKQREQAQQQEQPWWESAYASASNYLNSWFGPQADAQGLANPSQSLESGTTDSAVSERHEKVLAALDQNAEVLGWTDAHEAALQQQMEDLENEEAKQGKKEEPEGEEEKEGVSNADKMAALRKQQTEEAEAVEAEEGKEPQVLLREKTSTIVGHTDDGVPITVDVESKVTKQKDENGEDKLMVNSDVRSYQGDVMVSKTNAKTEIKLGEQVEMESSDGESMSGKLVSVNVETKKATVEFPGNEPIEIDLKAVTQGINEKLTRKATNEIKANHEDETPAEETGVKM